jgi:hypothetical protein
MGERSKGDAKRELKVGSRLQVTLTNNDTGKVVLRAEHEVVKVPKKRGIARGAEEAAQVETRLLSQEWFDPELEALNKEPQGAPVSRGAVEAAKIGVDAAKLGLDVAKFAWDVIKANQAVVDAKATTTSVLYHDTHGMVYEGAKSARSSSYTLSVRDSLIKSWECIHADVVCEATYHATPRIKGIPDGYYLPSVHVYSPKAHADFPCQINVKAELTDVSNMGTGKIDPMVTVLSSIDFGWLFQRKHLTVKFNARGSQGVARVA